jgi:hypothetical protein
MTRVTIVVSAPGCCRVSVPPLRWNRSTSAPVTLTELFPLLRNWWAAGFSLTLVRALPRGLPGRRCVPRRR